MKFVEQHGAPVYAALAHRESADTFWTIGHHFEAAITLERLGGVLATVGDRTGARQAWAHGGRCPGAAARLTLTA